MAIRKYTATTNPGGSDSGWECRFDSEFTDNQGSNWRVEIIDSKLTSSGFNWDLDEPKSFVLSQDGFTMSYEGEQENQHAPFFPSTTTIDFYIQTDDQEKLFTQLNNSDDHRFGIAIYRLKITSATSTETNPIGDWVPYWFGLISPEGTSLHVGGGDKFLRLQATDGLGILNQIEYKQDDGTLFDDTPRLSQLIQRCMKHIPTSTLWGYDWAETETQKLSSDSATTKYLVENIHYYDQEAHEYLNIEGLEGWISFLYHTKVDSSTFYDKSRNADRFGGDVVETQIVSCAEILDSICQVTRSRLFLTNGSWYYSNPLSFNRANTYYQSQNNSWSTINELTGAPNEISSLGYTQNNFYQIKEDNNNGKGCSLLMDGATESFLHPVRQTRSVHLAGGSQNVFAPIGVHTYINRPNVSSILSGDQIPVHEHYITKMDGTFVDDNKLSNADMVFTEGQTPVLQGVIQAGIETNHSASESTLHVGAHVVLKLKVKVGNYYLKGNIASMSTTKNIQRIAASDMTSKSFERDGDVEWTTTESTYSIPIPNHLCDPAPAIITSGTDDVEHVGGMHIAVRSNGYEFKYRDDFVGIDGTEHGLLDFDLNWVLPPMPTGNHEGVEVTLTTEIYESDGTLITDTSDLDELVPESWDKVVRTYNFKMFTGEANQGIDVNYDTYHDKNTSVIQVAASMLGDQISTETSGALQVQKHPAGSWSFSVNNWGSKANSSATSYIHQLNAKEAFDQRSKSRKVRQGTLRLFREKSDPLYTLTYDSATLPPTFDKIFYFDDETNDPAYCLTSMVHTAAPGIVDFVGVIYDYTIVTTGVTEDNVRKGATAQVGIPPMPGIHFDRDASGNIATPGGTTTGITNKLLIARNHMSVDASGISSITCNATGGTTPAVDLGEVHDVLAKNVSSSSEYSDVVDTLDLTADAITRDRSSQTGEKVATIDANGVIQEINPPTTNGFLLGTTSGTFSWQSLKPLTLIASMSGRASMYWGNRYYYGSTLYGYNYSTWSYSQTQKTSLSFMYAHLGIVCPTSVSSLHFYGSVRNDSAAQDVEIHIMKGQRPNGSSSSISLTSLGDVTASCGSAQDRHFNADVNITSAGLSAGDLIFIALKRAGTNGTQYVNFTFTLYAS